MCGIAAILHLSGAPVPDLERRLEVMNHLQRHRGPDGAGIWVHPRGHVGLGHRRLSVIDPEGGAQPMLDGLGRRPGHEPGNGLGHRLCNALTYNGEIYDYLELRDELGRDRFVTRSDTEVILHAYRDRAEDSLERLRGMFAFALWDEDRQTLFCARDRFGIKPLCYAVTGDLLYVASEAKALLPFLPGIDIDVEALKDYLTFQFCLEGRTLFRRVRDLLPGHSLRVAGGSLAIRRYWDVRREPDRERNAGDCEDRVRELLAESVRLHLRSDVPIGAYVSGGLDSSIVASLAAAEQTASLVGFSGKFTCAPVYDESRWARAVARHAGFPLHEVEITAGDFVEHVRAVIGHLDYPVAGPGSFAQFVVSRLASRSRKVVLGGQGGDEIFGGYARYLIACLQPCVAGAIDETLPDGSFAVPSESIPPDHVLLRQYEPLLRELQSEGSSDELDRRYFQLIRRTPPDADEVRWSLLGDHSPFEVFREIFRGDTACESPVDCMMRFDFGTLLPALLHVEDRMSMAHGVESRVPFLDHPLVELVATVPSSIKLQRGELKHLLKRATRRLLPREVAERRDKMGFPVPLNEWIRGDARDFVHDVLSSARAVERELIDNRRVLARIDQEPRYGRRMWGFLSLELWQQELLDNAARFEAPA